MTTAAIRAHISDMMTAVEIVALMRERQSNYAMQDNIGAAHTARALAEMIILAESGELPERPVRKVDAHTPDLAELKRKYLGQ